VFAIAIHTRAGAVPPEEPEPLLLALRVNGELLSESLQAVQFGDEVRLPLGELARLLEFSVSIDPHSRRIAIGGHDIRFDGARMTMTDDDVLAGSALVAQCFSVRVKIDRNASAVLLQSDAPLPYQLRRQREEEASKTLARANTPLLPRIANPYSLFDGPFVDARVRMTAGPAAATSEFDLFATGDVAGLSGTAFVSGTARHRLATSWLMLGRRDPDPVLLGFLHAREVAIGEIFFAGDDLVALPRRGAGVAISNFPLERAAQFDQQTVAGDLRPGEDVELYANNALAGYAHGGDAGGHFTFSAVPVTYGLNVFRLVFHGADGKERVEMRTYNVGDTLTRKGQFSYRVAAGARQLAEAAYGVTPHLTVTAAATSIALADGVRHDYVSGGLRATIGGFFAVADVGADGRGGTIERFGVQTIAGRFRLSAWRSQLQSYVSETYRTDTGSIAARSAFAASTSFGRRYVVPASIGLSVDELAGGGRVTHLHGTISAAAGRLWVTNEADATLFRGMPTLAGADSATGRLRFSRFAGDLAVRGEAGYDILPRRQLTTSTLAVDWRRIRNVVVGAAIDDNLATRARRIAATVRRDAGRCSVAFSIEKASGGGPVARIEVSASMLRNPLSRGIAIDSRPAAAGGAVAARVFLDRNANGIRDDGEPPIAGAAFFVNHGSSPVVTDADGHAFLDRLPAGSRNEISLSTASLDDPNWIPASPGAAFVARAGKTLVVDFPVVVTGEISGTVFRDGRPAAAVPLELVRADGSVAATNVTAYDGFYDFAAVRPGTYGIRAASTTGVLRTITISAEQPFDSGRLALSGKNP
jgi:hypothetical protein